MIRTKSAPAVLLMAAALACDEPDDVLFRPPVQAPVEQDGRFRVTFNPGPDVARGFTPDGRVLYRSHGLAGFGDEWRLLSIPPDGGEIREEAAVYRASTFDSVAQLSFDGGGRVLSAWRRASLAAHICGAPALPGPTAVGITIFRLPATDGAPLSALEIRSVETPVTFPFVSGIPFATDRGIRITPAELETRTFGSDPHGPAVVQDGTGTGYVSDGEAIWRIDLEDAAAPPDSIGPGAFPAISPDGRFLAAALATGQDSVLTVDTVPSALSVCVQATVTIRTTAWEIVLYDLAAGTSSLVGEGLEPRYHPSGARIVVRRADGLYWLDVASGEATMIPGTASGSSPAISPNGVLLAFTVVSAQGTDVFLVPIE